MTQDHDTADLYDVTVVGGGPAGYTAALRCAGHGLRVALVDRGPVGGTCLNVGCIPSKALIHAAQAYEAMADASLEAMGIRSGGRELDLSATVRWKDDIVDQLRRGVEGLLDRGTVDVVAGDAELVDPRTVRATSGGDVRTITARSIVLATGSEPVELPQLPFGGRVLSSTGALSLDRVPDRLVVVGAGYIGLELGTALRKLGAEVTVVEVADAILPLFDAELIRPVARRLTDLGITVWTSTKAVGLAGDGVVVEDADGASEVLPADSVLVTVGRRPVTRGLGLERLGFDVGGGPIDIDGQCQTSVPGVYAIGDVTGEPMLAHRGIAQGELVADAIAGDQRTWDHHAIPAVCFTDPEVFSVGLAPDDAQELLGGPPAVGKSMFRANGRALTLADDAGFVRVVADPATGVVLGVQGVGGDVAEIAASAALAVEMAATLEDLRSTTIAHPTLSEALTGACADAPSERTSSTGSMRVVGHPAP